MRTPWFRKLFYNIEGICFYFPDVSGITQMALIAAYKTRFGRVFPFPWTEAVCGSARDVYTPLDVVDSNG